MREAVPPSGPPSAPPSRRGKKTAFGVLGVLAVLALVAFGLGVGMAPRTIGVIVILALALGRAVSLMHVGILRRLSRRTTGRRFIPEIDGLRFVAIAMVVINHAATRTAFLYGVHFPGTDITQQSSVARVLESGWFGVRIFFLISGFVLALPFLAHALEGESRVDLKYYYLRRLTRIEPPYLVALALSFLLLVVAGGASFSALLPHLLAGAVYMHGPIFGTTNAINGAFWSLEVEVQFYLIMPVLALLFRFRGVLARRGVVAAGLLASIAVRSWWIADASTLRLTVVEFLPFFLAGFLLADIYLLDWKRAPRRSFGWDVISVMAWGLLLMTIDNRGEQLPWATPLIALVIATGAFRGRILSRALSNPWIYTIGGMCYSIYLVYSPVIVVLQPKLTFMPNMGSTAIVSHSFLVDFGIQFGRLLPEIALLATLFFLMVERPCMNPTWPRRLLKKLHRPNPHR